MSASPYFTLHEAAEYAHVSVRTLQRHFTSGTLKRYSFGHRVLIDRNELESLIRTRGDQA